MEGNKFHGKKVILKNCKNFVKKFVKTVNTQWIKSKQFLNIKERRWDALKSEIETRKYGVEKRGNIVVK